MKPMLGVNYKTEFGRGCWLNTAGVEKKSFGPVRRLEFVVGVSMLLRLGVIVMIRRLVRWIDVSRVCQRQLA
jgi:hypothetical protein